MRGVRTGPSMASASARAFCDGRNRICHAVAAREGIVRVAHRTHMACSARVGGHISESARNVRVTNPSNMEPTTPLVTRPGTAADLARLRREREDAHRSYND